MALPKGVKSPVDYTKLYMSNELDGESINEKIQEPKLPKTKGNVKSMNQVTFKPDDTFASIGARARGMVNRVFGGTETPERDQVKKDAFSGSLACFVDAYFSTSFLLIPSAAFLTSSEAFGISPFLYA